MARKAFYSFHYQPDNWRAAQVRSMGVIEGNSPASDNDWETIKKGGDTRIQAWIDGQLQGTSVAIVLIGAQTSGRKWITYEIEKAWKAKKGLLGIYIHRLKDSCGTQAVMGNSPFIGLTVDGVNLGATVRTHHPPLTDSKQVYAYIQAGLPTWIEDAIALRQKY